MKNWIKTESKEDWLKAVLERVEGLVNESEGAFVVGLAGGNTPKPVYEALANLDLPWERLYFVMIDERMVDLDNEASNLGMVKKAMPKARIHGFNTSVGAEDAVEDMHRLLYGMDFDLLIMGMGNDGHVASLFPDSDSLKSQDLAVMVEQNDFEIRERLSLTFEALQHANLALLLINGEEKKDLLEQIKGIRGDLPVSLFMDLVETEVYSY